MLDGPISPVSPALPLPSSRALLRSNQFHCAEEPMLINSLIRMALASILACLALFSPQALLAQEQPLGRIIYARATTLRGVAVPKTETLLSGDLVLTTDEGSALVELKSGARLKIMENSYLRFVADGDKVRAQLLEGAVIWESYGKPGVVVTASKYEFEPAQEGPSRYAVALSKEEEQILAGALKGDLVIRILDLVGSYVLVEGKYAAISTSMVPVSMQLEAGRQPVAAGQVGTVTSAVPKEVIQRQGHGREMPLKRNDIIYVNDVVRTLDTGRVQIGLLDGSSINLYAGSAMQIAKHDVQTQQTRVELPNGAVRAEVVKLTQPGASFKLQTKTATVGAAGGAAFVRALPHLTEVCAIEGEWWVRNVDPAIVGQLTLQPGQCSKVPRGLAATQSQTTLADLQSEIEQPESPSWHIGKLSEASSLLLLLLIGGAAAAAVTVPLVTSPTVPF